MRVFSFTGPPRRIDCLAPQPVCHIKIEASRHVNAQRHNQQACRLVLHVIHIVLSAKLPSNECQCLKSVGMTRQGKKPQDHQLPSPCSNYRAGKHMLHFKRYYINNLAQKARDIVVRTLMINLLLSAIQILLR